MKNTQSDQEKTMEYWMKRYGIDEEKEQLVDDDDVEGEYEYVRE